MKPPINIGDPRLKAVVAKHRAQMESALAVDRRVEEAVFPVYWPIEPPKPIQIGSGVAVELGGEYFLFTASHLFDDIREYGLLLGMGDGSLVKPFGGSRFSTGKGTSGTHLDDEIDASVFHIQQTVPEKLKEASLSLDDLDLARSKNHDNIHLIAGFRTKISKTLGGKATGRRECFPSIEYDDEHYSLLGVTREVHVALAWEDDVWVDGRWQPSPRPQGMSGGAIIRVPGLDMMKRSPEDAEASPLLSATVTSHRRESAGKPGVLVGTRIRVHLQLIAKYLPGLLPFDP